MGVMVTCPRSVKQGRETTGQDILDWHLRATFDRMWSARQQRTNASSEHDFYIQWHEEILHLHDWRRETARQTGTLIRSTYRDTMLLNIIGARYMKVISDCFFSTVGDIWIRYGTWARSLLRKLTCSAASRICVDQDSFDSFVNREIVGGLSPGIAIVCLCK